MGSANSSGIGAPDRIRTCSLRLRRQVVQTFPQVGETTGGQNRPVRSLGGEFVENVMFKKQSVLFATVHVVGSNNGPGTLVPV